MSKYNSPSYSQGRREAMQENPDGSKNGRWTLVEQYKNNYGLSDDEVQLLAPMILAGYSQDEIIKYLTDTRAMYEEREYNSESEQVSRMRAAGLNPDLLGLGDASETDSVEAPAHAPLPSEGGKGTLGARFLQMSGQILQFATFGLNAYGVISDRVISESMSLAGFADSDVLTVLGDKSGRVLDVQSQIDRLIGSRGFKGNRAKKYGELVRQRINSLPAMFSRVKSSSDMQSEQYNGKINSFKNSDEYVDNMIQFLSAQSVKQLAIEKLDMVEKQQILKFLEDHPDYNAEKLDAELRKVKADAGKAEADEAISRIGIGTASSNAAKAASDAAKAESDVIIAEERARQEQSNSSEIESSNAVSKLKSELLQTELEGYQEMIDFCNEWERNIANTSPRLREDYRLKHVEDHNKYRAYKRLIRKHYKGKSSAKVSFGAGPVTVGAEL